MNARAQLTIGTSLIVDLMSWFVWDWRTFNVQLSKKSK